MKKTYEIITEYFSGTFTRKRIFNAYMQKYYNLFMGAYKFKNLTEDQEYFVLKRFWSMGKIAAFIVAGTEVNDTDKELEEYKKSEKERTGLASVNDYESGMIAFTDFAPVIYNIYDWPIVVNLVKSRGASFIPTERLNVNESVVIGYAQKNHMPVKELVEYYVEMMVNCEMTIRQHLKAHKVPWLIGTSPEDEEKMKKLFARIENDEDVLYLTANEIDMIKVLITGDTYIIDKLYQQKQAYENELLTYLGIDNLGTMQKKEHLQLDEANSNNELINDFGDCFLNSMKEFCERVKTFLDYDLDVEALARPVQSEHSEEETDEEGGNEDENA